MFVRKLFIFVIVLMIWIWFSRCGRDGVSPDSAIVESKGKTFISIREFLDVFYAKQLTWTSPADKPSSLAVEDLMELKRAILDQLIEEKLILKKAEELQIDVSMEEIDFVFHKDYPEHKFEETGSKGSLDADRVKEQIRKEILMRKVVDRCIGSKIRVDTEEARKYYEERKELYRIPEQVRASQIVVATEREAKSILSKLKNGANFGELARKYSLSPDGKKGGDLGFFSPGQMPKEFDRIVFSLPVGQYSPVISSPYGYHIFLVHERRKGGIQSFQAAEKRLIAHLQQEKMEKAYREWIEEMKVEASIKVHTELLGHTNRY